MWRRTISTTSLFHACLDDCLFDLEIRGEKINVVTESSGTLYSVSDIRFRRANRQ